MNIQISKTNKQTMVQIENYLKNCIVVYIPFFSLASCFLFSKPRWVDRHTIWFSLRSAIPHLFSVSEVSYLPLAISTNFCHLHLIFLRNFTKSSVFFFKAMLQRRLSIEVGQNHCGVASFPLNIETSSQTGCLENHTYTKHCKSAKLSWHHNMSHV